MIGFDGFERGQVEGFGAPRTQQWIAGCGGGFRYRRLIGDCGVKRHSAAFVVLLGMKGECKARSGTEDVDGAEGDC
eukprot:scaffold22700_cov52-Cyclotella_meneghiniana.AAC.1